MFFKSLNGVAPSYLSEVLYPHMPSHVPQLTRCFWLFWRHLINPEETEPLQLRLLKCGMSFLWRSDRLNHFFSPWLLTQCELLSVWNFSSSYVAVLIYGLILVFFYSTLNSRYVVLKWFRNIVKVEGKRWVCFWTALKKDFFLLIFFFFVKKNCVQVYKRDKKMFLKSLF